MYISDTFLARHIMPSFAAVLVAFLLPVLTATARASAPFKLLVPSVDLSVAAGDTAVIRWEGAEGADVVRLAYTTDDGRTWQHIADAAAAPGEYAWAVPLIPDTRCRLRAQAMRVMNDVVMIPNNATISDFSDDGTRIATGSAPGQFGHTRVRRVWNTHTGTLVMDRTEGVAGQQPGGAAISPDGTRACFGGYDRVQMYDIATGQVIWEKNSPAGLVHFSRDGALLYGGSYGSASRSDISIVEAATGTSRRYLQMDLFNGLRGVHLFPDGKTLAVANDQCELWNLETDKLIWKLPSRAMMAVSPDGTMMAYTGQYAAVVCRVNAGVQPLFNFDTDKHRVNDVAFTPDGTRLVILESDSSVSIWSLGSRALLRRIRTAFAGQHLRLSPDGQRFAIEGENDVSIVHMEQPLASATSDGVFVVTRPAFAFDGVDFGTMNIGELPGRFVRELHVQNRSHLMVRVKEVRVLDGDVNAFSMYSLGGEWLEPGDGYYFNVRFTPPAAGVYRARLRAITEADTLYADVRGEVLPSALWPIQQEIHFGGFCRYPTTEAFAVLRNTDVEAWSVTPRVVSFTGAPARFQLAQQGPQTLLPGDTLHLHIHFNGEPKAGDNADTLLVALESNGNAPVMVKFYGFCVWLAGADDPVAGSAGRLSAISITPMPATDAAMLRYTADRPGHLVVSVVDVMGRRVGMLDAGTIASGPGMLPLDVRGLPAGSYLCVLNVDGISTTVPLVIAR